MESFWKTTQIPPGETRHWELGPLDLWVRHCDGEWLVSHKTTDDNSLDHRSILAQPGEFPLNQPYQRFAFDSPNKEGFLTIKPEFPDRSIVSKPLVNVTIPANSTASFFCGVPLWINLSVGKVDQSQHLCIIPTCNLSRTWFGTPKDGEACYASSTKAARNFSELEPYQFRVICPVTINNRSGEPLLFERICMRVNHLKLFQGKQYLWSNEIRVTKSSPFEVSQVSYGTMPPTVEPILAELAPSKEKVSPSGLLLRTFNNLRKTIDIH